MAENEPNPRSDPVSQNPDSEQPTVAAAVIARGGRVLLVRRRISEGTLSWQLPASAVEAGESPQQAAVREAREETTLVVTSTKVLGTRVHPDTGRTMVYVACDIVSGEAAVGDPEEVAEFVWASRADLPTLNPRGFFGPVQQYLDAMLVT